MVPAIIFIVLLGAGIVSAGLFAAIAVPLVVLRLRSESLVPRSTKKAIGKKLEDVHRNRRVREAIEDLADELPAAKAPAS